MCVVHILSGYYCLKIVWCGCWLLPLLDITSSDSIRMCEHAFAHLLTTNNLSTWCLTVSVMPVSRKKNVYHSAHTHTHILAGRYVVIWAAFFHLTFSWARRKKRRFIVNQPDNMILNLSQTGIQLYYYYVILSGDRSKRTYTRYTFMSTLARTSSCTNSCQNVGLLCLQTSLYMYVCKSSFRIVCVFEMFVFNSFLSLRFTQKAKQWTHTNPLSLTWVQQKTTHVALRRWEKSQKCCRSV